MKNKIRAFILKIMKDDGIYDVALTQKGEGINEYIFLNKCERCNNYTEEIGFTNDKIRMELCPFCLKSYKNWAKII